MMGLFLDSLELDGKSVPELVLFLLLREEHQSAPSIIFVSDFGNITLGQRDVRIVRANLNTTASSST